MGMPAILYFLPMPTSWMPCRQCAMSVNVSLFPGSTTSYSRAEPSLIDIARQRQAFVLGSRVIRPQASDRCRLRTPAPI